MHNHCKFLAIVAFTFLIFGSAPSSAEPQKPKDIFKSSEFLTWKPESQAFYIRTSVGMASLIVGQSREAHGKCVDEWYFTDETKANRHVLDVMKQHPEFHPRGVLLAIMEKKCGKFVY